MSLGKIGCSTNVYSRKYTYRTGCPPGLTPSYDIDYDGVWETTATTQEELFDYEEEVHNHFLKYRMMRHIPGDSEWFNFQGRSPIDIVQPYMASRSWVKRLVPVLDMKPSKCMKPYYKNLSYLKSKSTRNDRLTALQEPVISKIREFIHSDTCAGYVIAPCGSGKTLMTAKGCRGLQRVIVCCPSNQIQEQWRQTLLSEQYTHIHFIGGSGTTDSDAIHKLLQMDTYCIISTYHSCHLLVDHLSTTTECIILDEAHHMAGVVSKEDKGEGSTRRLIQKAVDLCIKRISLTYTPRFIKDSQETYLSMDDVAIFGSSIAELNIRTLIQQGVLPDYRIWTLRDESRKGKGILGKAECVLESWNSMELIRGEEQYTLHHLIVFAPTVQDAIELERFFQERTDAVVLHAKQGDNLNRLLTTFTSAKRAILVNCMVLNEGVDIPCANAVAIMYPKQSRGQITQMILRAGRWYEGKSIFHVIIPTVEDEDYSGFEEVLYALASCDERIRDEIILRSMSSLSCSSSSSSSAGDVVPECIMMDITEANLEDIRKCFTNLRKHLVSYDSKRIQAFCIEREMDTSIQYRIQKDSFPELPEDPRPKHISWYDYLHPKDTKMTPSDFGILLQNQYVHHLWIADKYEEWRLLCAQQLPSIQHMTDGYFGDEYTDFNTFKGRFGGSLRKRR